MKLGSPRGMDTKRPRGSERSKPCHESQLTRRSQPPYPWPHEQAQPGVSKPCRTTDFSKLGDLSDNVMIKRGGPVHAFEVSIGVGFRRRSARWLAAKPLVWRTYVATRGVIVQIRFTPSEPNTWCPSSGCR